MLGKRIKELRTENDTTQKALAEALGISFQAVSLWESDQADPSVENIIKLADFFDVSTDYLLGRETDFGTRLSNKK